MKAFAIVSLCVVLSTISSCKKEDPAPLPTSDFYVEGNGSTAPAYLYFYSQSVNSNSFEWDFGNGTSSVQENDSCLYTSSGTYEVWLYSSNIDLVKDSVRKFVHLN